MPEINNSSKTKYIYYLRLINKENVLLNEELNTIAPISSHLLYINKFNINESYNEFSFNLTNLENNEVYIASFFIKVVKNESEGEELYYSMIYEFQTEEGKEQNNISNNNKSYINLIVIIILIFIIILILFIFIIIWRNMRIKNRSLENKVNAIDFSSGINEDLINNQELSEKKRNISYENTFI